MRPSSTVVWPAPVLGLRRTGRLVGAPPEAASELDNFIPTATGARMRGGAVRFATTATQAKRLLIYRSGAVENLFAAEATQITDISVPADPDVPGTPSVTGLTSGDWSFVQFGTAGGQFLLAVNGEDRYHYFNGADWNPIVSVAITDLPHGAVTGTFSPGQTVTGGTSGATAPVEMVGNGVLRLGTVTGGPFTSGETITTASGSAVTSAASSAGSLVTLTNVAGTALSQLWHHKARLWFVEEGTLNAWYLPVNQFGGAAVQFSVRGIFRFGGALLFGGTWSVDSGSGLDDIMVLVTTEGEVAVYQGTDPASASTWAIVGRYRIARPLNKHSFFSIGADFYIMTEEGIVSLSEVMAKDRAGQQMTALTAPIEDLWLETIRENSGSALFPHVFWPSEGIVIIGAPPNSTQGKALVVNSKTGAWSRILGWDVEALQVFQDRLFYADGSGRVFRADVGGTDDGTEYTAKWVPMFQDMASPDDKHALMARAIWRADVKNARVRLGCYVNYAQGRALSLPASLPEAEGAVWGGGVKWGSGVKWGASRAIFSGDAWQDVNGVGFAMAPVLLVTSQRQKAPVFEPIALHLRFEAGPGL
jgi:hypothetical protein